MNFENLKQVQFQCFMVFKIEKLKTKKHIIFHVFMSKVHFRKLDTYSIIILYKINFSELDV